MKNYQMQVIPEPKPGTASVLVTDRPAPFVFIRGPGSANFLCGACQSVLVEGMERGQITEVVFKCPKCGSFNRAKGT
jgi:predicted RNA-binding Zn-ribbon protein involved in translation (DUF1610 family)